MYLGAGFLCASRIDSSHLLAFIAGLCLSMVTFVIGATLAFLLSRRVLPPSCGRRVINHFPVLRGESRFTCVYWYPVSYPGVSWSNYGLYLLLREMKCLVGPGGNKASEL